jgi:hypothetical protein
MENPLKLCKPYSKRNLFDLLGDVGDKLNH